MIKKTIMEKKRERALFIILFFISIIFSNLGIPGIENSNIMPNYFLALIISCLLNKNSFLNLYNLVIFGLIVDILCGQLLGQYGFLFISIYFVYFIIQKITTISNSKQLLFLGFCLSIFSFIALWATSLSHKIFIPFNLLFLQFVLTFITYLIFNIFITRLTKN